jgi:hypothetical protein
LIRRHSPDHERSWDSEEKEFETFPAKYTAISGLFSIWSGYGPTETGITVDKAYTHRHGTTGIVFVFKILQIGTYIADAD